MSHTSSTLPQFLSPIVLQVHEQDATKTGGPGDAAFTDNIWIIILAHTSACPTGLWCGMMDRTRSHIGLLGPFSPNNLMWRSLPMDHRQGTPVNGVRGSDIAINLLNENMQYLDCTSANRSIYLDLTNIYQRPGLVPPTVTIWDSTHTVVVCPPIWTSTPKIRYFSYHLVSNYGLRKLPTLQWEIQLCKCWRLYTG